MQAVEKVEWKGRLHLCRVLGGDRRLREEDKDVGRSSRESEWTR